MKATLLTIIWSNIVHKDSYMEVDLLLRRTGALEVY
jgi:hypothetical protein